MSHPTQTHKPARLGTGSAAVDAMNTGGASSPLFQPDVTVLFPSDKKVGLCVRIKPGHDLNRFGHADFGTSVAPYRTAEIDSETGHPKFSSWIVPLRVAKRIGDLEQLTFVSPLTRKSAGVTDPLLSNCPVADLYMTAKRSRDRWGYLIAKPTGPSAGNSGSKFAKATLSFPSTSVIVNVDYTTRESPQPTQAVLEMSQTAFEYLAAQLNAYRPAHIHPFMPNSPFNQYMLDDVTNPQACRQAWMQKTRVSNASQAEPWCVMYTKAPQSMEGLMAAHPLSEKDLLSRRDLASEDTVLILPYQEIVDRIVEANVLPYDLLAAACSNLANVGSPQATGMPHAANAYGGEPHDDVPMRHPTDAQFARPAAGGFGQPAPATGGFGQPAPATGGFGQPAPAASLSPSAMLSSAQELSYWVTTADGTPVPTPVAHSALTQLPPGAQAVPVARNGEVQSANWVPVVQLLAPPAPPAYQPPAPPAYQPPAPPTYQPPAPPAYQPPAASAFGAPPPSAFGAPTGVGNPTGGFAAPTAPPPPAYQQPAAPPPPAYQQPAAPPAYQQPAASPPPAYQQPAAPPPPAFGAPPAPVSQAQPVTEAEMQRYQQLCHKASTPGVTATTEELTELANLTLRIQQGGSMAQ